MLALSAGFFALRCSISHEIPFVFQNSSAPWVMPPSQVAADLHQWGRERAPLASFRRPIRVDSPGGRVTLRLRALRGFAVHVNGEPVAGGRDDGAHWRDARSVDLTPALRAGWNDVRIDVANAHGPALLSLRIDGLAEPVVSDASWSVAQDGRPLGPAILADDTRRNSATLAVETPLAALVEQRDPLLAFFVLGIAGFLLGRRWLRARAQAALPAVALLAACAAWLVIFFDTFVRMPVEIGFDARHHALYVDMLRTTGAVPVATDGWSVYHPPLFYALAALCQWIAESLAGPGREAADFGLKLLPFLAGLANVWVAAELCRRLFPEDSGKRFVTAVFAAVLPMNLYAAAYFSNETFHTLLAGLAVLACVDLLLAARSSQRRVFVLGLLVGLALLTKYTALIVGAVGIFFVVCKLAAVERAAPARVAALAALFAAPPLLLAGWFYARNFLLFGDPLIGNWGNMPGPTQKWWQQPGFHTAAFYLSFGEALNHPYLSAFRSFWDSLYSTAWGDGGIAGRVNPAQRHGFWNYGFMSAGYLVAVPASLLVGAGAVRCAIRAFRDADPRRRAVFSFLATLTYAVLFGLMYMSLRLPYFGQGKATYGLVVMPILALFFADGLAWLDAALAERGWLLPRAIVYGWFSVFAATCFLSFAA
jgi:hypothetical protein